ncbi:hypothetical protein [Streptomyces sp. NPDC093568]|uniref:hypothetical protein n=1 Tax=Streptomyces sp. NPDC093568 TaxID=3366041 RepID=UPI0038127FF0
MLEDFWKGLGGKFAERWLTALFSPAFAFWAGGFLAWLYGHGWSAVERLGWLGALRQWTADARDLPFVAQALLVVGLLILITLSGLLLQHLSRPTLRLLEGYWPARSTSVREWSRRRLSDRANESATRLRALLAIPTDTRSAIEAGELGRLRGSYQQVPPRPGQRMPTRLGNVLRAAELRPGSRYGLDAVTCWPRLWLLLPKDSRQEVAAARIGLYLSVQSWLCAVAFTVFVVWAWWAPVVGLAVAWVTYYTRMLAAARTYGTLIESCFDIHRGLLYAALNWPRPANPLEEYAAGQRISAYLTSGSRQTSPTFTDPPPTITVLPS